MLSESAADGDKLQTLAASLCSAALERLGAIGARQRLFVPVPPGTFDSAGRSSRIIEVAEKFGISLENLVVQIPEIEDPKDIGLMIDQVEALKSAGIAVALSGVGDGNASLRTLSQIKPDFIKIAPSLVRDIDFNPIKRAMVESLITLARKLGLYITAEGIKTPTEMGAIMSMDVDYGQGKCIGRASDPKPETPHELNLSAHFHKRRPSEVKCSTPIAQLVKEAPSVTRETLVRDVRQMLVDRPPMSSVVVVTEDRRPIGLLMTKCRSRSPWEPIPSPGCRGTWPSSRRSTAVPAAASPPASSMSISTISRYSMVPIGSNGGEH